LNQLAATGLIETLPNRGAVVKPFGPKQLRDFYELRQVLEGYATKLAHRNINREELADVHKATAGLLKQRGRGPAWSRRAMDVDERLHEMISTASGNDRLREEINRYRKLMRVVRATIANEAGYQEQAIAQHLKILEALVNDLPDEAARLMHEHIGDAAEAALAVVFASAKEASMATDEANRSHSTR
ncbi:MAG: GntR family transcriptional regulator, partial [Phycisphaeraceae bacterium]